MKLAAYIHQGRCFIAKFGGWRWLYNDIPGKAKWIRNEKGGKCVTAEDIDKAISESKVLITSFHFSTDDLKHKLIDLYS